MPNGNNYDIAPVSDNLNQVGNSDWYISPNEPVSPNNCALFPNSPYCGGSGTDIERGYAYDPSSPFKDVAKEGAKEAWNRYRNKQENPFERYDNNAEWERQQADEKYADKLIVDNEFETCLYVYYGKILGINSLPPIVICKRKNKQPSESTNETNDDSEKEEEILISDRVYPDGCILFASFYNKFQDLTLDGIFLGQYLAMGFLGISSTDVLFPPCRLRVIAKVTGFLGGAVTDGGNLRRLPGKLKSLHYYAYDAAGSLIKYQDTDAYSAHKMRVVIKGLYLENDPVPPHDPNSEDDMCDCSSEIDDLKKLIRRLTSMIEFEAKVPSSLTDPESKEINIKTIPNLIAWQTQQLDALLGQFPIEVEIKDVDPNQKGDQKQTVKIPNLAEAIADLYGLQFQNNFWQQIELQTAICQSAELIAIRNQTLQTLKSLDATNDYLGVDFETEEMKVNSAFNPKSQIDGVDDTADQWTAFLQPSEYKLQIEKYKGKDTLIGAIKNLLFSAGIIKARFWQVAKRDSNRMVDDIQEFTRRNNEEVDKWAKNLEDPKHPQNNNFPVPKIKIKRKAKNGGKVKQ